MAKIMVTVALILAMVAMASAYSTITTTVVEDEYRRGQQGSQEWCQKQFEQQQELRHCQEYIRQGSPIEENPIRRWGAGQSMQFQCCEALKNIDEECRCEAIKQMIRQQQQGRRQFEQQQEIVQRAMELPRQCKIEPRQCQIRAIYF